MVLASRGTSKALPLVDILTLAATGSEFDGGGVISNMALNKRLADPLHSHRYLSVIQRIHTPYLHTRQLQVLQIL